MTKINLFDFDETIYDGDSTVDFFKFIFKKKPITIFWLFVMLLFAILYVLRIINKTTMKETFYKIFTFIDVNDDLLKEFWDSHEKNIKKWYLDIKEDTDVIITANYDFLIKIIEILSNKAKAK